MAGQVLEQVQPLFMLISTRNTAGPESGCRLVSAYKLLEDYGGWYDTDHINLVQGSAFAAPYSHIKDRCTGIM